MVMFTGFAIPVSIVPIAHFWPAGIALAAFFAWQWTRIAQLDMSEPITEQLDALRPDRAPETTGNASFDAYRAELLERLEQERTDFEAFLVRLRAAKDEAEFDQFMDARAAT